MLVIAGVSGCDLDVDPGVGGINSEGQNGSGVVLAMARCIFHHKLQGLANSLSFI